MPPQGSVCEGWQRARAEQSHPERHKSCCSPSVLSHISRGGPDTLGEFPFLSFSQPFVLPVAQWSSRSIVGGQSHDDILRWDGMKDYGQ